MADAQNSRHAGNRGIDTASPAWLKTIMRSSFLVLCGFIVATAISSAQVTLSAGRYTQTFDTIGSGLPTGWNTYTSASATSLGTFQSFTPTAAAWSDSGGAFKNLAAADNTGFIGNEATADQNAALDRALGVRQTTTTGFDPGAAFAFNFNTSNLAVTSVSFSAQMLSVQARSTTWLLQYGIGASPTTWTTLATYADSGAFGSTRIVIPSTTIGSALTNQANVWLRVVALAASSGSSGSVTRDTFAIDDFEIEAATAAVISSQPSAQTVVVGNPASFSVSATGSGTLTYKWRKDLVLIAGNTSATTDTFTIPAVTMADAGSYDVVVTDANGSMNSAAAVLTVTKAAGTVTLENLTVAYNGSPQSATATTIPAGKTVTFTYDGLPALPTNPGSYAVVATINDPDYAGTAMGTFTITKATATVTLTPTTQTYNGTPRIVTATTAPAGRTVDITYDGSATAPTNAGSYTVVGTVNDTFYQGSTSALLAVLPGPQVINFPAPVDHLPDDAPFTVNATATSGLPVTFSLADGSPGIATLAGNVVTLTGVTGAVTVRASQSGGGNFAAAPFVDRVFHVVSEVIAPRLTVHPSPYTGLIGDRVTLTGAADGSPAPTYQWLRDNSPVAGATNATLTIPSATVTDTGLYVIVASNSAGTASSVPVAVAITKRPQTISFTSSATAVPAGSSLTLSATSSSGLPVTMTFLSGPGTLSGNILTGTGGNVVVRATQAGDAAYAAATVERTFNFVAGAMAPFITSTPVDTTVAAEAAATLRVSAIGTPTPTYQWQKDGADLAGATNSALTFEHATLANAGRYTVVVSNSMGSVTAAASLFVRAAPIIIASPTDQTADAGTSVRLSVEAAGYPAMTYQWRRNGTAVAGATNSTLVFASVRNTEAGRYDVVVTNELGAATSAVATLGVNWRDFSGFYFGRFSGATGDFAMFVRIDGTAVFVGHLPGLQTGLAMTNVIVDNAGSFTIGATTILATSGSTDLAAIGSDGTPPTSAAPQAVTVRGTLDEVAGTVTGTISELGASLAGTRAPSIGAASAQAGYYSAALIGSAAGQGYILVAPDGGAYVFTASGSTIDSASGTIGSDGRLKLTTATQAALDLGFSDGIVSGTVRLPGGITGSIAGVADGITRDEHLANLSVRSIVAPTATLITGFVITGESPKQVLIRAAGPALAAAPFNLAGALGNPSIQLFNGSRSVAQNDNWGTPAANATTVANAAVRAGAFPFRQGSQDAALLRTLAPGAYTVVVGGGTGIALAEVYEVMESNETPGMRRLVNVSARGPVIPGSPLIAGFVISGAGPQRVLIRGVGPTLGVAPFNVAGVLPDPELTVFRGNTPVKTNDDWFRDPEAALIRDAATAVGAFALGAQRQDAAVLLYLAPGAYTAVVSGPANANAANGTGVALIEVYEVGP
ncbi:MAG: immunoglobulin domain-containing protein [Opitutaceae bacterium]|nr:immunoglobulin domain-containing protein [Opitutaceae bacterium]